MKSACWKCGTPLSPDWRGLVLRLTDDPEAALCGSDCAGSVLIDRSAVSYWPDGTVIGYSPGAGVYTIFEAHT